MKILYGVVGEGMGHAMRSRVVLGHLIEEGHEVAVMASQRAVSYLARWFPDVRAIHGMHIITEENRVRRGKTLWKNVEEGLRAVPGQIRAYFDLVSDLQPECVITDFESWTYLYGRAHRLPVFSVDNNQMIQRCEHPRDIVEVDEKNFRLARAFVKAKLPGCDHYFVTSFFDAPVRKQRTTLHAEAPRAMMPPRSLQPSRDFFARLVRIPTSPKRPKLTGSRGSLRREAPNSSPEVTRDNTLSSPGSAPSRP